MQKVFVFDVNKCTGCAACRIACRIENDLDTGIAWREVITFNPASFPGIPVFHHSLACNHCVNPPCLTSCPARAYSKDPVTGAVLLDTAVCIGCKYCSWACPFDAPKFNPSSGVMEKCTFCNDRLQQGSAPSCVSLCPTGALQLTDDTPTRQANIPGFPRADVDAAIRFVPLDAGRLAPETSLPPPAAVELDSMEIAQAHSSRKITLRNEWTLVVFSQIVAWLTGYTAAVLLMGAQASAAGFGVLGVLGIALSALHLGKKERAVRAMLNWRRSWLSREVILTSVFVGLGIVWLAALPANRGMGCVTVCVGLAGLFAIDRVYSLSGTMGVNSHSAQVLLTGVYAAGLLGWNGEVIIASATLKLLAYGARKHRRWTSGDNPRIVPSTIRVVLGFVVPVGLWVWLAGDGFLPAVVCAALGEMVDRCEFYAELDVPSPRRQMSEDLRAQIAITYPSRTVTADRR